LIVVGTGAEPDTGEFCSAAVRHITKADRVLYLTRWPEVARALRGLRPGAEPLHYLQDAAPTPADGCLAVAEEVLSWVRIGQRTAAVFVGPPARAPAHITAALALSQNLPAAMVPAVSHDRWLAGLAPATPGAR
jgi:hypothetical protein